MKDKNGFSLIEVIITIAILSIAVISVLSLLTFGQKSIYDGGNRSIATYDIQDVAENIMSSNSISAYITTNPAVIEAPTTLNIEFPGGPNLPIVGRNITITKTIKNGTQELVFFMPN